MAFFHAWIEADPNSSSWVLDLNPSSEDMQPPPQFTGHKSAISEAHNSLIKKQLSLCGLEMSKLAVILVECFLLV